MLLILLILVFQGRAAAQFEHHETSAEIWEETRKITASDAEGDDQFGYHVALKLDTVVAGARHDDDACPPNPDCNSGAAYIFERDEGGLNNWGEVRKLTASDLFIGDSFGLSVAVDGDTVLVGSRSNASGPMNSGAVYVFERNNGGEDNWGEATQLTASDAGLRDHFGISVALDGDTAIVGATWDDDACPADLNCNSGSVYVFERNEGGPGNWGELRKLTASDADSGDEFGSAVALEGDTIVVGTIRNAGTGSAYIFGRNEGGSDNWGEVKKLTPSDVTPGDWFGSAVAISESTVLVGANSSDDAGDASGSAYVFERSEGGDDNWGEVKKLTASDAAAGDFFGVSASISGDTAVVGAWANDDAGVSSGSAYVFRRDQDGASNWGEVQKLTASDAAFGDRFGASVVVNEASLVVGAYQDSKTAAENGSAYIFEDVFAVLFADGFESGNTSAWSTTVP